MNATAATEKFATMLKLEDSIRQANITAALGKFSWDRERGAKTAHEQTAELYQLTDSLSLEEMAAFGQYRQAH